VLNGIFLRPFYVTDLFRENNQYFYRFPAGYAVYSHTRKKSCNRARSIALNYNLTGDRDDDKIEAVDLNYGGRIKVKRCGECNL